MPTLVAAITGCGGNQTASETEFGSVSQPLGVADRITAVTEPAKPRSAVEAALAMKASNAQAVDVAPTAEAAFADIVANAGGNNMQDLMLRYLDAVSRLPADQQHAARMRLVAFFPQGAKQ